MFAFLEMKPVDLDVEEVCRSVLETLGGSGIPGGRDDGTGFPGGPDNPIKKSTSNENVSGGRYKIFILMLTA